MGKIKQWIVAHKLLSTIIASVFAVGLALAIVLPITLSHKHTYGEDWEYDETGHYHTCSCGHKSTIEEHDLELYESLHNTHTFKCSICEYVSEEDHVYESDTATKCLYCEHTRETTTLAFKTGGLSKNFTYNGEVQTFNKENLVQTNASMDYVIVEYSLKGSGTDDAGQRIWTTEPKDAGDYFIRVRVEADDNYTGLSIDTLEDTSKELRIQAKTLSLENLALVYSTTELNTSYARVTVDLTDEIDGLCGSDTLQATLYKTSGSDVFSSGEVWTIEDLHVTSHAEKYVGLQTVGNNYRFDSTTTGKLYIANGTTYNGNSLQEKHEATSVHIDANSIAYYSVNLNRSNRSGRSGGFATYYSFDFTNNLAVKVVDAFSRNSALNVKLVEGQLLVYSTIYGGNVIIGVKYEVTDGSGIDNTFKMIENVSEKTVTDAQTWENALKFTEGGNRVTLKKNGEIIEESKYYASTSDITRYYKKDSTGETYYSVTTGENYQYYIYEKNEGVWARRSLTDYYDADEANADALSSIRLNEEWLKNIISAEAFANFTFSYEDLMYHTDGEYTLNGVTATNIALRFAAGKLAYVEFTSGNDKYTIAVVNSDSNVTTMIILPIKGSSKVDATNISYADSTFSAENVTLYEGDNWFVIDVTAGALGDSNEIIGTLTTSDTSKISSIVVMKANGTALTNDINDEINEFDFENITTGKYYIKVTVTSDCTGSWGIGFVAHAEGSTKNTAIEVPFTDSKFTLDNIELSATEKWFVFEITGDQYNTNKVSDTEGCKINGSVTLTGDSSATLTFYAENASGSKLENQTTTSGKIIYENLSAGKYYIKISATESCTGSLSLQFFNLSKV